MVSVCSAVADAETQEIAAATKVRDTVIVAEVQPRNIMLVVELRPRRMMPETYDADEKSAVVQCRC
jgi:hypothetical protein